MANEIEKRMAAKGLEAAVNDVVVEVFKKHERIIFNGNGYGVEWHQEAERRGLPNVPNAVDAMLAWGTPKNVELFSRLAVLSPKESDSRMHIQLEGYSKAIAIEGQSALSVARTMILPAAQRTQRDVAQSITAAKDLGLDVSRQFERLQGLTACIERCVTAINDLGQVFEHAESHVGDTLAHAKLYRDQVVPAMARLREHADLLETLTDDSYWPLPKYREMLFVQ